jgi:biopolymer transport protein ExbD
VQAGDSNRRIISDINVTPMVDIMLVLLIIFMVTASYITRGAFDVKLPTAANGSNVEDSALQISISPEGSLSINGNQTDIQKLREMIAPIIRDNPDVQAVVDGDRGVEYGRVMEVIDVLKTAGVRNFAAAVERVPGTVAPE